VLTTAAIEVLRTVGYARATTKVIAKQASVTTGALHHHFPTKGELMLAVLDHASSQLKERLEAEGAIHHVDAPQIRALVEHLWHVHGHPEYWAVWEVIIGTRADPLLHERVVRHRSDTMQNVLVPWLDRLALPSEARDDVLQTFEFMLIAIRGLGLECFLDKDAAYFDQHLSILAEFLRHRLQGIREQASLPAMAAIPAFARRPRK
jgi:AcrR family transcriptional regulator